MKLYLRQHEYKYAIEQMLLMLFPGRRPEYPEGEPPPEEDSLVSVLETGSGGVRAYALLTLEGRQYRAAHEIFLEADWDEIRRHRALQHGLKQAFFQAAVAATGFSPPWGSLTGVRPVKLPTRAMRQGKSADEAARELGETYHVSPRRVALAMDCARASLAVEKTLSPGDVSLYAGIPFCPGRCSYCSFISADAGRSVRLVEPYLEGLHREIAATGAVLREGRLRVKSFYLGGGTPTILTPEQLERLFSHLEKQLPLQDCVEITVEAGRPDTITPEKLEVLRRHGVGRISVNPQTLSPHVLAAIGRMHRVEEIASALDLARRAGFSCINMDLIAGLPQDDFEGFCRSLDGVVQMGPEHITVHTLALKRGSGLMTQGGSLPSGEVAARMLDYAIDRLRGAGYLPYYLYRQKYMSGALENVGWCRPGTESVYNICMMEELHTVLSLGAGGMTKLVDPAGGRILRLSNPKYPQDYLSGLDKVLSQKREILSFCGMNR